MPTHHADAKRDQAQPGLDLEDTQWVPEMSPQRDHGHERENGEAEEHGHGHFGPVSRSTPVGHDRAPRDEEGEPQGQQDPRRTRPASVNKDDKPRSNQGCQQVERVTDLPGPAGDGRTWVFATGSLSDTESFLD